jgi:ribosome-associated protein
VRDLRVTQALVIPASELTESFVRSTGPGGQNVNKVSSKVELRWSPASSAALAALTERDRTWLLSRLASTLTAAGDLVVRSSHTRDQARNRTDARHRMAELLRAALRRPRRRIATKPTRGAVERRLTGKKRRAQTKRSRGPVDD